ncbi:MAG: phytoene/squalene synthase family protein [Anaerolineae bacterium]
MTLLTPSWEHRLLNLAYEALHSKEPPTPRILAPADTLQAAYAQCDAITAHHSKTFSMASSLLPEHKRRAVRALYAFCRITDDIIDSTGGVVGRSLALEAWEQTISNPDSDKRDPVALAWADARAAFRIPASYARQLINGCARDLHQTRYTTFEELAEYAYGVASTVGLMAMHIIGFEGPQAIPYAVKLGVALQITNILRDVAEDLANGRVYLPQDELAAFGLSEADLARGQVTDAWRAFMKFQIARNRRLYAEAWPGIKMLSPDGRFAIAAAAELYRAILADIETHDYDVFTRRASVSTLGKLRRLPGIWWRSRGASPAPSDRQSRLDVTLEKTGQ